MVARMEASLAWEAKAAWPTEVAWAAESAWVTEVAWTAESAWVRELACVDLYHKGTIIEIYRMSRNKMRRPWRVGEVKHIVG